MFFRCTLALAIFLGLASHSRAGAGQSSSSAPKPKSVINGSVRRDGIPRNVARTLPLKITPIVATVNSGQTINFKVGGGLRAYHVSVSSGGGSVAFNAATSAGVFTAPILVAGGANAVSKVKVSDSTVPIPYEVFLTVTVIAPPLPPPPPPSPPPSPAPAPGPGPSPTISCGWTGQRFLSHGLDGACAFQTGVWVTCDGSKILNLQWIEGCPRNATPSANAGANPGCNWSGSKFLAHGYDAGCAFKNGAFVSCNGGVVGNINFVADPGCPNVQSTNSVPAAAPLSCNWNGGVYITHGWDTGCAWNTGASITCSGGKVTFIAFGASGGCPEQR